MNIIAVAAQKGGVGKTTSTVNLGAVWAEDGLRVLVIDADPQASATKWLQGKGKGEKLLEVYRGDSAISDALQPSVVRGIDLVASGPRVHGVDKMMAAETAPCELNLKYALEDHANAAKPHDIVIIDCPPSLGFPTVAALAAAPHVVVPVGVRPLDSPGLAELQKTIATVSARIRSPPKESARSPPFYDSRTSVSKQMLEKLKAEEKATITDRVDLLTRIVEAPAYHLPLTQHAPKSRPALQYRRIAEQILKRITSS